jgi:hypothetical protein
MEGKIGVIGSRGMPNSQKERCQIVRFGGRRNQFSTYRYMLCPSTKKNINNKEQEQVLALPVR